MKEKAVIQGFQDNLIPQPQGRDLACALPGLHDYRHHCADRAHVKHHQQRFWLCCL